MFFECVNELFELKKVFSDGNSLNIFFVAMVGGYVLDRWMLCLNPVHTKDCFFPLWSDALLILTSLIFQCQGDPKGLKISTLQISYRSHQSQNRQDRQVGISRSGNSDRGRPSFCPTVDTTHFGISSSTSVFQEILQPGRGAAQGSVF